MLLGGLALLAVAELGLVHDLSGNRISPKLAALGVASLVPMAVGAWIFVRWPVLVTPLVALAPLLRRLPKSVSESR